jgi:hypothetical protein
MALVTGILRMSDFADLVLQRQNHCFFKELFRQQRWLC